AGGSPVHGFPRTRRACARGTDRHCRSHCGPAAGSLFRSVGPSETSGDMKATIDHIGIAVADLAATLAFYRDALGLEIDGTEDVESQHVRAHFIPVGPLGTPSAVNLELLEATAPESPIAKFIEKRGPGLHHITLRVDDVRAAVAQLKARGIR